MNSCRRARGAGYRHGNRRGCLRGTREIVLGEIESWIKDFNKSPVFWLNGLAGTGKSTIAQTIAERMFADDLLGASFFCSRDFEDRSNLHFIFPTLAFQLAHKYPDFRVHFVSTLQSNPDVVDESLYNQMEWLIVEPLQSSGLSAVIVIDALDECKDDEPSSAILSVLGRFVKQIPRVKFFITGRPEDRIKTGFRLPLLVDSTDVFVLHNVPPTSINNDIRLFLKHDLSKLAQRRQLDGWPSDNDLDILCHRAAGLFVYAVATIKFLDSNAHLPKKRLDAIIDLPESTDHEGKTCFNSKTTLDSLYTSILNVAFGEHDPGVHSMVQSTIGAVVLLTNPLPPSAIGELIGIDPEEVRLFLTLVQSLLVFNEDPDQPVKPFHKSFPDFITNPSRCTDPRFYISPVHLHIELITNCLRVMNDGLEQNLLSLPHYTLNSEVEDLEARVKGCISIPLQYACQSWHNHLTKTGEDITPLISSIHVFLEEKFLAWLEVISVLGATRGAITALEQLIQWLQEVCFGSSPQFLTLMYVINQVGGNKELLETARDCFYFVAKFFEPINVSAIHIYHSALELAPLSSIVRRLYYHQRCTPFPKVITGIPDAWDKSMALLPDQPKYGSHTWSPCGQFIATGTGRTVKIRDSLTFELLSTLTGPSDCSTGELTYSPDGCSLACHSGNILIIWDIQTGGVARQIEVEPSYSSSAWSLDGGAFCTINWIQNPETSYTVCVYNVALGKKLFSGILQSRHYPQIWAHTTSFRIMTTGGNDQASTIEISEVWSILTKIESFHNEWFRRYDLIGSFSPTTYRISIFILTCKQIQVLDIRNSESLLVQDGDFFNASHSFSSDASLFALSTWTSAQIWKYTSGCYVPWREFLQDKAHPLHSTLQFSPTLSSILSYHDKFLYMWHLDDPPIIVHSDTHTPPTVVPSSCGTYVVTYHWRSSSINITNLRSQIPPQSIDTNMEIRLLGLTGNVLLVWDSNELVAWLLTEEGAVNGVSANEMASHINSIWTISSPENPFFLIENQAVVVECGGRIVQVYHTGTGRVLESTPHRLGGFYPLQSIQLCHHYPHYCKLKWLDSKVGDKSLVTPITISDGWVKDLEGKHWLWIPTNWRVDFNQAAWLPNTTLWLNPGDVPIVVTF